MSSESTQPRERPWWLRPMTLKSLKDLHEMVREAHSRGLSLASVTMNQIEIALKELQERMERDAEGK